MATIPLNRRFHDTEEPYADKRDLIVWMRFNLNSSYCGHLNVLGRFHHIFDFHYICFEVKTSFLLILTFYLFVSIL